MGENLLFVQACDTQERMTSGRSITVHFGKETNTCLIANCLVMYDSLLEGLTRRPYRHIAIFLLSAVRCSRRFSTRSEHFSWNKQENR